MDRSWPTQPAPKADHRNGSSGDPIGSPFAITAIIFAVAKRCRRCLAARWSRTAKDSHRLLGPNIEIPAQGAGVAVCCMCHTDDATQMMSQCGKCQNFHIATLFHYSAAARQVSSCQSMELLCLCGPMESVNGLNFNLTLAGRRRSCAAYLTFPASNSQWIIVAGSHAAASSDVFCLTRSP